MKRRDMLRTVAISTSACLAGCPGDGSDSPEVGRAQIGAVALANITDQTYSVTVQIERNGEMLHDGTHELSPEPDDGLIERTWPCEPARFVVRAQGTGDDEPREEEFTEEKVFNPTIYLENRGQANVTHNSIGQNDCMS